MTGNGTPATRELDVERFQDLVLGADGAAFDTKTGRSYRLNPSGEVALRLLQDGVPEDEVVRRLASQFSQHVSVVAAGTETFLGQLRRYLP
jgi:hypothetical protein